MSEHGGDLREQGVSTSKQAVIVFLSTHSILFIRRKSNEATNLFSTRSDSTAPTMLVLHPRTTTQVQRIGANEPKDGTRVRTGLHRG